MVVTIEKSSGKPAEVKYCQYIYFRSILSSPPHGGVAFKCKFSEIFLDFYHVLGNKNHLRFQIEKKRYHRRIYYYYRDNTMHSHF